MQKPTGHGRGVLNATPASARQHRRLAIVYWVTLVRGLFAIVLGLGLVVQPDRVRPLLLSFMGAYWVAMGLVSIRLGLAAIAPGRRLPVLAGTLGVVAGAAVLLRDLLGGQLARDAVTFTLGLVILLTGLLHVLGMFRVERELLGRLRWMSRALGALEVGLGAALIVAPFAYGALVYWMVTVWAILGGLVLLIDAVRLRREPSRGGARST
jgi:uncharacterized membrane protein HdeD (DUF308 family)